MKKVDKKKKKLVEEIVKKRIRKKVATSEFYKAEMPEHFESAIETAKSTAIVSFILFIILIELNFSIIQIRHFFILFFFPWFFWKICQVAITGWTRLNRLHKIIQEEKYEIEHHRKQERKELQIIYSAKGFSGKLLDDVIDVLMADDNRLLQVMMEEEMGLTLRRYEHPLKQGIFAGVGAAIAACLLFLGLIGNYFYEFFIFGAFIIILASVLSAKYEKNNLSFAILWNLAIGALISFITFFATKFLLSVI